MTALQLYHTAMNTCGLLNADGTDNDDCTDYLNRSVSLINILLSETLWLERLLSGEYDKVPSVITAMSDTLDVDDLISSCVLPFGLASLLIADEDPALSSSLYERYKLNTAIVQRSSRGKRQEIEEQY